MVEFNLGNDCSWLPCQTDTLMAWIAHIVIYLLIDPPLSAFLNEIFIKLDDIWGLLGTAAFALFCFYLLIFVIAVAMMIGLKLLKAVVPYNLMDGEEKSLVADSNFLREHVAANIFNNEHGGFLGLSFIEIFLSRMHVAQFCLNVVAWRKEWRCEQWLPVRSSDIGNKLSSNYYTALRTVIHVQDHEFIQSRISGFSRVSLFSWLKSFFKQFFRFVSKSDYTTLRLGFVMNHCSGNPKFNFYKYMTRALENDFKKVIEIRCRMGVKVFLLAIKIEIEKDEHQCLDIIKGAQNTMNGGVVWFLIRPHYMP
ncbi:hypothetical protein ACS0TY_026194 [Phlomoides rotata]